MALSLRERSFAADKSDIYIDGKNLRAYGCFVTSDGWTIEKTTPSTNYTDVPDAATSPSTSQLSATKAKYSKQNSSSATSLEEPSSCSICSKV